MGKLKQGNKGSFADAKQKNQDSKKEEIIFSSKKWAFKQ
jgi:hypothetical protein